MRMALLESFASRRFVAFAISSAVCDISYECKATGNDMNKPLEAFCFFTAQIRDVMKKIIQMLMALTLSHSQ